MVDNLDKWVEESSYACNFCNTAVDYNFHRVNADNDGDLYACQDCSPNSEVAQVSLERKQALQGGAAYDDLQ